ncbi:MAG: flagellar biosynthesis protein FlhF [Clostridia bacterium]|nr:flagellar biosynthesis protein FlhF [Clostridia bacterium]
MIIKKFQAKTEKAAVEAAKKELGPNVVVMNVKNVKKKGLFASLKPAQVEVTVALEEELERNFAKKIENAAQAEEKKAPTVKKSEKNKSAKEETNSEKVIEEKLESLHSLLEQQLTKENEENEEEKKEPDDKILTFVKLIYHTLLKNEVNEKYANELTGEVEKLNKPNATLDYVLANIYQRMILKFGQPKFISPAEKKPKIVFFIGPTGVGKTTTIAKIASKYKVNEKKKIALLTTDTYRIAAAEQLRTYANILDTPFRVIYTTDEMLKAIKDFLSFDYIFVDTAGHSHQNQKQRENMSSFLSCLGEDVEREIYLVLSATTKYTDLLNIADAYSQFTNYRLIFTKLDETDSLGNLLNLRLYTGADLSYVTCGQDVPNDIECFNPQTTVKKLLGGK